jgi:hypothetical protein
MSSVDRNKVPRGNHARSPDQSLLDAVAQRQLPVSQIVFARITQRGETVIQPDLQIVHSPQSLLGR